MSYTRLRVTDEMAALPADLVAASLNDREIVLAHDDALRAIDLLLAAGFAVYSWEAWMRYPDGRHAHPVIGLTDVERARGESFEAFARRAADIVRRSVATSQAEHDEKPYVPGTVLYFCLATQRERGSPQTRT